MYGFSYERLLGDGRNSIAVAVSFHGYTNDQRRFHYLHLPTVGLRRYFKREGNGLWIGGKIGYVHIDNAMVDSYFRNKYDTDYTKAHLAELAAELGAYMTLGPHGSFMNRIGLFALGGVGAGAGWKKTMEYASYNDPGEVEESFGFMPTFEGAAGLGIAF